MISKNSLAIRQNHQNPKKPQQRLKVCLIHPAYGLTEGGVQTFISQLAPRLAEHVDVTVLCGKSNQPNHVIARENKVLTRQSKLLAIFGLPRFARNDSKKNVNYQQIFSITRRSNKTKFLENLLKPFCSNPDVVLEHLTSFFPVLWHLLTNDYDVLFPCNDWGGLLVCSIVRKVKKTPIIFTEHCGLQDGGSVSRRNRKFKPDKYIVLSPEMEGVYIPNGVDLERFSPRHSKECKAFPFRHPEERSDVRILKSNEILTGCTSPQNDSTIFICGRNYQNKRLHLAIKAVATLENVIPNINLILASPSTDEELKEIKKLGQELLGDRFSIVNVPYSEIVDYYQACDVFTLPSAEEPFGLVYLEALACNKPVVATDDLVRNTIIGDAGILCNPENIDDYANALKKALERDWGNRPFEQAQKFSIEKVVEKYLNVIFRLKK